MFAKYGGPCLSVLALLVLTLMTLGAGQAQAASQYSYDCTFCHQMPPLDSGNAKKNPDTGAIPGNHQGHASAAVNSCAKCHGDVSGYAMGHRNKTIELADGIGYSRKIAAGFVNQTSVPPNPMGTCSTVACHSDGKGNQKTTPSWGAAPFQAPGDCSQCHDVAPASGNHPTLGSKHASYFGTGTGSCVNCHTDHTAQAKPFSHATSAGRAIEVALPDGGSFAANKCSNLYCHSNGQGSFTPPTWGATLDCAGCHGTATSNTLSGKHAKHVNNPGFLGTSYGCVECHSATVSDNGTIANFANHVNKTKDVAGAHVGTPVSGTCSTSYCHTDGKGVQKSVTWTQTEALTCKSCHGSDMAPGAVVSIAGEPNYKNAGADQPLANSHANHVFGAASCQNCHVDTTVDGVSIKAGAPHTDGTRNVAAGNGKSFTIAGSSCSAVSCHDGGGKVAGVGAVKWGQSLGCVGCHGDSATLTTNAHAAHVSTKAYACDTCHSQTVTGSSTFADKTLHGDSLVEVAGARVNSFSSDTKNCTTSCHLTGDPKWNDKNSGACGTCHKALSTTVNGLVSSNAHSAHFTATYGPSFNGADATSCSGCHTPNTAASHADGLVNLAIGYNKVGACSSCHKQSTNWAGGRVTCESCHSTAGGQLSVIGTLTAPDKTLAATAGHGKAGVNQSCSACHDANSNHINGVTGDKRLLATLTGAENQECNYCHTDPAKATGFKLGVKIHQVSGLGSKCADCHNAHGTANSMMVNGTINGTAVSFTGNSTFANGANTGVCQVCHTATDYFKKDGTGATHVASTRNCLDCHAHNPSTGLAFMANGACDACHGYPPAPRKTNFAVSFAIQGSWSSARFEDYSGGGGAHVVAAHIKKDAKPSEGWANCLPCHFEGQAGHNRALPVANFVENVTVKVDPQYRFSDEALMSYTSARLVSGGSNKSGSCFNVSCHFSKTKPWSIER